MFVATNDFIEMVYIIMVLSHSVFEVLLNIPLILCSFILFQEVLLQADWAMKLLPMYYREKQSIFFGARGLSWHIIVATYKNVNSELESKTIVHVFSSVTQDAEAVISILEDSIIRIKEMLPAATQVKVIADNAGCYHGNGTLAGISEFNRKHKKDNIQIVSIDFCDPQSGKGQCDRRAAHFKGHFRRKVNSGYNITNSLEVTQSFKNVSNAIALQSELTENVQKPTLEIEKISTLNNFQFDEHGIKCWRQYKIGAGNNIVVPTYVHDGCIKKLSSNCKVTGNPEYTEDKHPTKRQKIDKEDQHKEQEDPQGQETSLLYTCPEQCIKVFLNYGNLQRHLDIGKHVPIKKYEKLSDRSKKIFRKLSDQSTPRHLQISEICKEGSSTKLPIFELGFALKVRKKATRFNNAQRDYLDDIFDIGVKSKKHASAADVAKKMMKAKTKDGKKCL